MCYCMTYNGQLDKTLVGYCPTKCFEMTQIGSLFHLIETNSSLSINKEVCGNFNREGQLCGDCVEGYGPPVYSYSYQCVKCDKSMFKSNLLKYNYRSCLYPTDRVLPADQDQSNSRVYGVLRDIIIR